MRKYFPAVIFTLLVAFLPFKSIAQINKSPDFAELERVNAADLREKGAAGAAVTIVNGDKVVFALKSKFM